MKNFRTFILLALTAAFIAPLTSFAQEEESSVSIDGGFDMYTSYIWRGSKFGTGPAFQPWAEVGAGGFAVGAWGSVNAGDVEEMEMDLYLGYSFDFGLSLTVTDYFFGTTESETEFVTDITDPYTVMYDGDEIEMPADTSFVPVEYGWLDGSSHTFELAVGYEIGNFSILASQMVDSEFSTGDMYFEAGYAFDNLSIALGAGNGAYVAEDDDFTVCNITVGTSKDIEITEKFTLPLSAAVTLNPSTGGFFITAGVSF